jgi:signal transduction histidine kinase
MTDTPLYNSRILHTFAKLVEKKYCRVDLDQVLRDAGIKRYELSDDEHWFTQRQVNHFVERLVEATGKSDIAREAGRYAASVDSLGAMTKYLMGLIGPANAFHSLKKICANLTRSSSYESRKLADNQVEITVTPAAGVVESHFQCENRLGFFEAILTAFSCAAPVIDHPECVFRGDGACRYLITWKQTLFQRARTARNYLILALFSTGAVLIPFAPWMVLTRYFPGALILTLAASCFASRLEKRELYAALASLKDSTDQLLDQTGVNYNNALMVNEVGQAISKQAGIDQVLENVVRTLQNRLSYDRGLILLADPEKKSLSFRTGFGYSEPEKDVLRESSFNLTNPDSQGVFVTCFHQQKPVLINDFADVARIHSSKSQLFAEKIGARSFLCCAIVCEGESLGILAVDNIKTKKALVQSDLSLLMGIAPIIGISIRNAMYIERDNQRAEQMRQSQKMEAIGQLAGGIAHDFNNLLTAIIGFTTLAQLDLDRENQPSKSRENQASKFLDEVLVASERATHLTKGLLSFSRKQAINPHLVELNAVVGRIENMLRRLISEEIELVLVYADRPLPVIADAGQLDQIIMNLVTNARDAMNHTGVLTIETSLMEVTAGYVADYGYCSPGRYARLSISDTGMGMDEATKTHIFEPFFTTKAVGKGTGLGLAIVYGIVKQHNGFIGITSSPGIGTTFNIFFPLPEQAVAPQRPDQAPLRSRRGSETVLVVEDAQEVRTLTRKVLESHGYQVIEAVDGEDAVEQFVKHQDAVKLIIMDVVMPKMNGKEAYASIASIRPGIKVLFTSGYTPDDVSRKGVHFDKDNFLAKPSSPQDLLKMVADLLT